LYGLGYCMDWVLCEVITGTGLLYGLVIVWTGLMHGLDCCVRLYELGVVAVARIVRAII
jgi:hypothetical protein